MYRSRLPAELLLLALCAVLASQSFVTERVQANPDCPGTPIQGYWYAVGCYISGTPFGVRMNNRVYDPYIETGHVVEADAVQYDGLNFMSVGWAKKPPYGIGFFVDWAIDGQYGRERLGDATPNTWHRFTIKLTAFYTEVWVARIDGQDKKYLNTGFGWVYRVQAQSESYGSDQNEFDGRFYELKYGGAYFHYFVWEDWSNTDYYQDAPYEVYDRRVTNFKTRGPI